MTYEEESVTRELLKHYLEQARATAARLPEFEGVRAIRHINAALEDAPLRVIAGRFLRALPTWGTRSGHSSLTKETM